MDRSYSSIPKKFQYYLLYGSCCAKNFILNIEQEITNENLFFTKYNVMHQSNISIKMNLNHLNQGKEITNENLFILYTKIN